MSASLSLPREDGRYFVVNRAHILTGLAFAAMTLSPLIGTPSAAIFLTCGFVLVLLNVRLSVRAVLRWWPLLVLPLYCLLSTFWSQFPSNTLRYATQMMLTLMLALVIAERVDARAMLRVLFAVYGVGVILSLALNHSSGEGGWTGFLGSKNAYAAFLAVFALTGLGTALDETAPNWLRGLGLLGTLASAPLLLKAQSAGALITIVPCCMVMLAVKGVKLLTPLQKTFALLICGIGAAALALVAINYGDAILGLVLETSGKDSTLTGRTDLWSFGLSFIAEHPLLGVGYRAFWVVGNAPAEQLWAMFLEPSGAGFNFHDLYISNAVELGLVGIGIEVVIIYAGLALTAFLAIVRPSGVTAFFLGSQLLLVLRSFVEVEVFFEFSVRSIIAYCTLIYALRGVFEWLAERRAQRATPLRRLVPADPLLPGTPLEIGRYDHG